MAGRNNPPQRPGYAARRQREGLAYGSDVQGNPILGGTYNALEPYLGPASAAGLTQLADYTLPFYGGAATVMDGANYIKGGDYGMGAAMIGLGSLEFLPYAGKAARAVNMDGAARFLGDESGAIRAWHGSPHDFDKFDMNKIGTGEGAQAYGHGLYFAENKSTADAYKSALSRDELTIDGKTYSMLGRGPSNMSPEIKEAMGIGDIRDAQEVFDALSNARFSGTNPLDEFDQIAAQRISELEQDIAQATGAQYRAGTTRFLGEEKERLGRLRQAMVDKQVSPFTKTGKLYEVEIDANPEDFLDWDAPLSEQPEGVRKIAETTLAGKRDVNWQFNGYNGGYFQKMPGGGSKKLGDVTDIGRGRLRVKLGKDEIGIAGSESAARAMLDAEIERRGLKTAFNPKGADVYAEIVGGVDSLVHDSPNRVGGTDLMREAGIPGIRYYDQGSRTAGDVNELRGTVSMWRNAVNKNPNDDYAWKMFEDAEAALADAEKGLTRNYVVFDDQLISIVKKYGIAGAAAMLGMSQAEVENRL